MAFNSFGILHIPQAVLSETQAHVPIEQLSNYVTVTEHFILTVDIDALRPTVAPELQQQDTDLAVLVLAQYFPPDFVLTDDLLLRRELEARSLTAMRSVGILLRAYRQGILDVQQLDTAIDGLFTGSTLYLSPGFKAYVQRLIAEAISQPDAHDSSG
jgi:predicted nucleic acid-binding protein